MNTLEFKGIKFVDDTHGFTKNQIENVDSWLYKIMEHYELNGIVTNHYEKKLITEYEFTKCGIWYESKELNEKYQIFDFFIKIKNDNSKDDTFTVLLQKSYDLSLFFHVLLPTLDEAIKFCNILINYETLDILQRNLRLFNNNN